MSYFQQNNVLVNIRSNLQWHQFFQNCSSKSNHNKSKMSTDAQDQKKLWQFSSKFEKNDEIFTTSREIFQNMIHWIKFWFSTTLFSSVRLMCSLLSEKLSEDYWLNIYSDFWLSFSGIFSFPKIFPQWNEAHKTVWFVENVVASMFLIYRLQNSRFINWSENLVRFFQFELSMVIVGSPSKQTSNIYGLMASAIANCSPEHSIWYFLPRYIEL